VCWGGKASAKVRALLSECRLEEWLWRPRGYWEDHRVHAEDSGKASCGSCNGGGGRMCPHAVAAQVIIVSKV